VLLSHCFGGYVERHMLMYFLHKLK
jgi:hypothetical protein